MKYYKIGFAGAGNLAWHLAQDLEKAGHFIRGIWSQQYENAELLANQLYDARPLETPNFLDLDLDLIFISVGDDFIEDVAAAMLVAPHVMVAHTSGSKSSTVLLQAAEEVGVFYPLQTFTKERSVDFSTIPICIEGNGKLVFQAMKDIAESLSKTVLKTEYSHRKVLHLAAVLASNFSNHLLFHAHNLLLEEEIPFKVLKPLMMETIAKAFETGPENAQTGPARRHDKGTIQTHLDMLSVNPELAAIYQWMSKSIMQNY